MNKPETGVADTAVFHLVRAGTDFEVLLRFLASYERFPSGAPHRLVFLLKGFPPQLPARLTRLLDGVPHAELRCPDRGFDLGSYFYGSARVEEPLAMFTNSFSELLADRWLAKLLDAHGQPRVGVVGATGSWESLSSECLHPRICASASMFDAALARGKALAVGVPLLALFPRFPNVHLRTNGFLLARRDFIAMRPRLLRTKLDAWLFESGRHSMTRQVLRRGLDVRVVGRDGSAYRPDDWMHSLTFWRSRQENLLIHDNRTIAYDLADPALRAKRSEAAWGSAWSE